MGVSSSPRGRKAIARSASEVGTGGAGGGGGRGREERGGGGGNIVGALVDAVPADVVATQWVGGAVVVEVEVAVTVPAVSSEDEDDNDDGNEDEDEEEEEGEEADDDNPFRVDREGNGLLSTRALDNGHPLECRIRLTIC